MKTLGPGFLAEFKKHKSLQAAMQESLASGKSQSHGEGTPTKIPGNSKKPLKSSGTTKVPKKDGSATPGPSSASEAEEKKEVEKEDSAARSGKTHPASYNRLLREDLLSCGTVLQLSDLPDDGFSDQDIKKIVQPFGKVSDLIVLRSRNEAYLEMNYKEAVMAAVKFGETTPVLLNGKRIRISVAEGPRPGQVKKVVKKRVLNPKKTTPSTKKVASTSGKSPKPLAGKKEKLKKAPALPEQKGRKGTETGAAAAEENSQAEAEPGPSEAEIPEDSMDQDRDQDQDRDRDGSAEPGTADPTAAPDPPEPTTSEETPDGTEEEEAQVVLISELPERGVSEEELRALARPFGIPRDLLVLSSHKKALLELPRSAAESLLRFHGSFPLLLEGRQLRVQPQPRLRSLRDEEAIFISLIQDSDPKVSVDSLRDQFVLLGNLPAQGFRELELVCVGLRFGKVEHYVVLSNRNRAILQLDSPGSARAMHGFLQQYSYSMGEHTLTCSLASQGDAPEAEAGKKEVKREEGSRASSGCKKIPEGSGTAANPSGEPRAAKKGPNVPEEIPEGKLEIPESQEGGAARESDPEGADPGMGIPGIPAGAGSEEKPGVGKEEAHPELELDGKKEDEEASVPAMESLELSGNAEGEPAAIPVSGDSPGAIPGATFPSSDEAPTESPGATQPSTELAAPEKIPIPEAGKSSHETSTERKAVPKSTDAPGKKLDAEREGKAEESTLKAAGENPGKISVKAGAEQEKPPGKAPAKGGAALENSGNSGSDGPTGILGKIPPNKGTGAAKSDQSHAAAPANPAASLKESCMGKTLLKAVVSVPDILKQRIPIRISEPSLGKAGEQKIPPKPEPRGQTGPEKKIPSKNAAQPGPGSGQGKGNGNSGADGQGDSGKSSSQQEKDSQPESRPGWKQGQQGESGTSGAKGNPGGNQAPGAGGARAWKSGGKQKEEEELFPFNLDEFVTVDEVLEEAESPAPPRRNPPRAKRKEGAKPNPNPPEPAAKRRKGKSSGASAAEGPEEMGILGDTNPEEEVAEISKPKAQLGSGDAEPKSQQKKTTFPGVPKTQSTPKALDILVPKAGFFCQICSLFYADEPSMINHCRTPLHRQNMEKFMAKQQEDGGEEPSSR